jgi:hypothetical protein
LLLAALLLNSVAFAEKPLLSVEELHDRADVIVVATIKHIRVKSEPSRFEPSPENSDWGIYLTLRLETIKMGGVSGDQLEARCFRIRHRKRFTESLTPSGHHPIPATGTRVRVYLEQIGPLWLVVLPNGIVCIDGNAQEAREVAQLRNRANTDILSLETWVLLISIGISVLMCLALIVRWYRRR